MAYTPTTWATGDTITASAMNKIENGIASAGGALIVNTNGASQNACGEYDYNETLDATFAEIYDTLAEGKPVYIKRHIETDGYNEDYTCCSALYSVLCAYKYDTQYRVYALSNSSWSYGSKFSLGRPTIATFSANSPSDYPTAIVNAAPTATQDVWD